MSAAQTAPSTDIHFSQVREDPQLELTLLEELAQERGRPLRVLCVGSGGCTALSMLSSDVVERVDAVDINPAQVHLIELRRAALEELNLAEQLLLIGEKAPDDDVAKARLALYDRVRDKLPESTRAFWDARREGIAFGVNHVGTFDRLVAEVGEAFQEVGIDALAQPARALGHESWSEIFHRVFDTSRIRDLIGTAMANYSVTRSFAHHFSAAFAEALRRFAGEDNYFLSHIFRRGYDPESGVCPPYLLEASQSEIKSGGTDRLKTHTGNFLGKMLELKETEGAFDLIQTSDLSDWMPVREVHKLFSAARSSLAEGGAVLSRRLCGDHHLGRIVSTQLSADTSLSNWLHQQDRSFLYSEIVVGFRPAAGVA